MAPPRTHAKARSRTQKKSAKKTLARKKEGQRGPARGILPLPSIEVRWPSDTSSSRWRRCYPLQFQKADDEISPVSQPFGDLSSLVNALRMRRIYRDASLRLLSDLVYVARGGLNRDGHVAGGDDNSDQIEADYPIVQRAAESSACLYRSLRLRKRLNDVKEGPAAHPVILGCEAGLDAPIDALAHLLAASIARQFGEAAVAVTFAAGVASARLWIRCDLVETLSFASYAELHSALEEIVGTRVGPDAEPFFHVIVAATGEPGGIPEGYRKPERPRWQDEGRRRKEKKFGTIPTGYDRIIYLAREVPDSAPEAWASLLGPGLRSRAVDSNRIDPQGPYFSSFIVTVIPPATPLRREFETEVADLELQDPRRTRRSYPPGWRLRRDQCRLPFDLDGLSKRWRAANLSMEQKVQNFVDIELENAELKPHIERWARAVTNRQVGVALSGGGASSYRLVPLIKGLDRSQVPVDVVSGISGGALLAAYYCGLGGEGLETYVDRGMHFQIAALTAIAWPNRVSDLVNEDLGSMSIGGTDRRFVAVTTALLPKKPPETRVVIAGTLGEAAQASGAAPVMFRPVEVGSERFSDGASATLLPARVLKDWGADFVFAFNCLPGPLRRNPLDRTFLGRKLYDLTIVGRIVDAWVAAGSTMQRVSREACEDAHVYFEPDGEDLFLVESFLFVLARRISRKLKEVEPAVADCEKTWQRLRLGGLTMGERFPDLRSRSGRSSKKIAKSQGTGGRERGG